MKKYLVEYSNSFEIEAEDEDDAYNKANDLLMSGDTFDALVQRITETSL